MQQILLPMKKSYISVRQGVDATMPLYSSIQCDTEYNAQSQHGSLLALHTGPFYGG